MDEFAKFKLAENNPSMLIGFARECVTDFSQQGDAELLVVARRIMLRLSHLSNNSSYWIDRFALQLQNLELAFTADAHLKDIQNECLATLNELGAQLGVAE